MTTTPVVDPMDEVLAIDVDALLAECGRAGITLTPRGTRLIAEGPRTAEVDRLLEQLALVKSQAIARLTKAQNSQYSHNRPSDPRSDLEADSRLWDTLLTLAWLEEDGEAPEGAFGALHGIRCCGARVERQAGGALKLVGAPDYFGEWEQDRDRWLVSHRDRIRQWLGVLA